MRVLVLCEYASLNGGERSLLEAIRHITASDMELTVAAPSTGPLADALRHHGLQHLPLELFDAEGVRYPRPRIRQNIADSLAATHARLLHANSLSMSRLAGPVVEQLNVPSIGHLRDIIRISRASIDDLNRHRCLLAVSHATRQSYVDAGLDLAKAEVAYNGVDLTRFQPRAARGILHEELNLPADSLLVGSVGQVGMRKGVDLFVEAASQVAAMRRNVHFIYVGQRYSQKQEAVTYENDLLQAATRGALKGRFHFLGARGDVDLILNELALYVHAARQEPLGRVLLEAGAAATAIIATDVGGTREIFPESAHAAVLVPPQSSSTLAAAIEQLLTTEDVRRTLGSNARQRIAAAFDGQRASHQLEHWYRTIGSETC